jgi:hypothetical protein
VAPNAVYGDISLNTDESLEKEADRMQNAPTKARALSQAAPSAHSGPEAIQRQNDPKEEEAKAFLKNHGVKDPDEKKHGAKGPDEMYRLLTATYILPSDIISIGNVAKTHNIAVSVRESGKHTLAKLAKGAGAKGHDILEKTIKESSLGIASFDQYAEGAELPKNCLPWMIGLVAKWEDNGSKILGLHLTPEGIKAFDAASKAASESNSGSSPFHVEDKVLRLDNEDKRRAVDRFIGENETKGIPWERYFYTGDYDLHDMVSFTSQRSTIPSESFQEKTVLKCLNEQIAKDNGHMPYLSEHPYQRVRHGPQVNYIAHSLDVEPKEKIKIIRAVADMTPPVAMCDRGRWSVLSTKEAIRKWYEDNRLKIKITWKGDEEGEAMLSRFIDRRGRSLAAPVNAQKTQEPV